jgi:hypothetical protein
VIIFLFLVLVSLIGRTKEVDMAYTRSHSEVRMKVEVTRVEFIPTTTVDHTMMGRVMDFFLNLKVTKPRPSRMW